MQESYGEGVTNHPGSESCGPGRKARYEALKEELRAKEKEPRNTPNSKTPTHRHDAEGHIRDGDSASRSGVLRGLRTWHAGTHLVRKLGDLCGVYGAIRIPTATYLLPARMRLTARQHCR
jgi:hypothetical protein